MRVSDKAIVLQATKSGDSKYILKLYCQNHGSLTVGTRVSKSAGSKIKISTILPLHLIDIEFIYKQNKEIHQLSEASCYRIYNTIHTSISKLSIAQFLNEVLSKALREHQGNTSLFEFIESVFNYLDESDHQYSNLHLYFLIEFTKYLGFEPQNNFSKNAPFFDCREGQYTPLNLVSPMGFNKEESELFSEILKINVIKASLNQKQRQTILDILLSYYSFHVPGFNSLRSTEVLKEIFTD